VPYAEPITCLSRNALLRQLRLHFLEWGRPEPPPVLMLHGRMRSAHVWDLTGLALQDRYHLLALDQRGHGDSEWTRNEDYSLEAFVQDALAFSREQALKRPVLVGHGLGALVALGMAVEEPALPRAIVIVDMAPEVTSTTISRVREYTLANAVFEDVETFVEREHHRSPYRSRAEIAETACYELLQRNDGKYINKADPALQEQLVADRETPMFQLFAFDDAKAPTCPVLIVRGEFSNVLPADAASRFAGRFANAKLVTLPAAAHEPHTQNVSEFVRVLSSFLESL
jgi:pimeloyl-ACP methyl ester carboxylesterase